MDTYKKNTPDDELAKKGTAVGQEQPKTAQSNSFQYAPYQPSDAVKQAQEMLKQQMAQKPGAYQSPWQTQLNDIMGKIMNREKFRYDLNGDALAKQYQDQFTRQGKMAMMDTMGQAAALTGGYGNSYAQTAGQQTYQGYLQQMNDKIPELYQLAMDKYQMEGQDLMSQYSLLGAQEERDYGRYRDQVADHNAQMDRLQDRYDTERDYDYGKWADDRDFAYGQFADDRAFDYQQDRDAVADQQWQASYDEDKRRYDQEYEDAKKAKTSSGGSSRSPAKTSGIPDSLITWLEDHVGSNSDVARYLDAQVAAGNITADQADQLYGIYVTEEKVGDSVGGSDFSRVHGGISGSFASKAFASKSF